MRGNDEFKIWVPVHDEAAATMPLAARGIGVAPGTPFNVPSGDSPHIRVTVGLLADQIDDEVADAAHTTGWGNRAREVSPDRADRGPCRAPVSRGVARRLAPL